MEVVDRVLREFRGCVQDEGAAAVDVPVALLVQDQADANGAVGFRRSFPAPFGGCLGDAKDTWLIATDYSTPPVGGGDP